MTPFPSSSRLALGSGSGIQAGRHAALACCLAALAPAAALGSGYEFEGVGARQISRAGAAVADADDWTAVYWNPAGLARAGRAGGREIGLEVFGGMMKGEDSNSLSSLPGVGAIFSKNELSSSFLLGAAGAVIPLGSRAGLGMGVYTPLLQGSDFQDRSAGGTLLDLKGYAGLMTWNLASAGVEVVEGVAVGAGLNMHQGRIKSELTLVNAPLLPGFTVRTRRSGSGLAAEGVFGLRWDPRPEFTFGAAYRGGADIPIRGSETAEMASLVSESRDFKFILKHPPTLDLGVALRPSPRWTLTLDSHQTFWSRFSGDLDYAGDGALLKDVPDTFSWRDTWKVRLGARRKLTDRTELLAGYSFDRSAVDAASVDLATTIEPSMHRLSAGWARRWGSRLETTFGAILGYGGRTEAAASYRLRGFQLMAEARLRV